jgi:hypothetical protein
MARQRPYDSLKCLNADKNLQLSKSLCSSDIMA